MPDWEGLLKRQASLTGKSYNYYKNLPDVGNDKPKIARKIAKGFYDMWWNDDAYKEEKDKYEDKLEHNSSPLKLQISKLIRNKKLIYDDPGFDISEHDWLKGEENLDFLKEEIEELREATINGVITTNWDLLLKNIFPSFDRYIGQEELLLSNPREIAEIYKIHGCSSSFNSLILTDKDYEHFNDKNPYLAAKLLTIFIEHPIIFIGYSMSDKNIINILNSITECISNKKQKKIENNLIFIEWDLDFDNPEMSESYFSHSDIHLPMMNIKTKYYKSIFEAISKFQRKFPPKIIRELRTQVYNMVKSTEPASKIEVYNIDEETSFEDVKIICGVGIEVSKKGFIGIRSHDLFKDIIFNDLIEKGYDTEKIIDNSLAYILKNDKYVPIYKYLRLSGYLKENSISLIDEAEEELDERIIDSYNEFNKYEDYLNDNIKKKRDRFENIEEIRSNYDELKLCLVDIIKLSPEKINIDYLFDFLKDFYHELPGLLEASKNHQEFGFRTDFRRLIRIYDWLKYGMQK